MVLFKIPCHKIIVVNKNKFVTLDAQNAPLIVKLFHSPTATSI